MNMRRYVRVQLNAEGMWAYVVRRIDNKRFIGRLKNQPSDDSKYKFNDYIEFKVGKYQGFPAVVPVKKVKKPK